jgi:hypothetical protein
MNIVEVSEILAQHGSGGDPLQIVRLSALEPRREPFVTALCQPHGTIHASAIRIGNANSGAVLPMYRSLLHDALHSQAQLVITPEYSAPWDLIREIAAGPLRPPRGGLWVLGCESITPDELELLRVELQTNLSVHLIHEPFDPQQRAQRAFVDPVLFAFWAENAEGAEILCFLVQFKTVVSRDPDHIELQHLYRGTTVYKFSARPGDVSLLTLICSDAFEFTNALIDEHCTNLLLVHIQLNQRPGNADYAAYRARMFSVASNSNVEIICLNWAKGVLIDGSQQPWNAIAGSAWYVSPNGLALTDAEVDQLHKDGLYYSIVGSRWHAFYVNFAPHILTVSKQPVFSTGPQVIAPRMPPRVLTRSAWDFIDGRWAEVVADDGFKAFLQPYATLKERLPLMCTQAPLAVERALELLEGPTGPANDWFTIKRLSSLQVAEEESLRRFTVSQETDVARHGVVFRQQRARRAQTAATIPGQPVSWPPGVSDLSTGFQYRWSPTEPHDNVEPIEGGRPAALLYLGEEPEQNMMGNIYAKIRSARKFHAAAEAIKNNVDLCDAIDRADDRLCVVYRENHVLHFYCPKQYASITDPANQSANDIAGEHQ